MTTLRKTLAALGFISLGAIGSVGLQAAAGPGGPGGHGGPGGDHGLRVLGRAMSQLDLSDEQQAALDAARDDIRARMDEARDDLDDERGELHQALVDGTLQRKDVKARIKARMDQAEELMLYTADRVFDVYETLDSEQRAELVQVLDEVAARHEQMRERRDAVRDGRGDRRGPGGPGFESEAEE
ncbi:periplasmic heavy metal sensor [Myxococcota bacterium]|nr:periplasmic heavy metal sensor [Myxococcota bacterium]